MATRPQNYLNWTDGSPSKVVQPPSNFALQGWQAAQAPPFQYMNYLFYITDQWIKYLDPLVTEGVPDQAMRLLNGGTFSFNATTGVLAWSADFNIVIPSVPDSANQVAAGSVTLPDGYLAYVDLNTPMVVTGDTQTGSPLIQNVSSTNGLTSGMVVTGAGIPNGATVLTVTPTSVTISANATATANSVSLTFAGTGLVAHVAQSSSFVPSFNQILFARRAGAVAYVGVNTSQMILRDGEYKPLLGSGYFTVYEAPAGQNLTAGQVVYLSMGNPVDSGRTAGALYPLDASAVNQQVRGIFAGVVISDVLSGATAEVLYNGFYLLSGLTPGLTYYADPATPGAIVSSAPSGAGQKIVPVGFAVTATHFLVSGTPTPGGSFTTPVFNDAVLGFGNAVITDFLLPSQPLSAAALFVYVDGSVVSSDKWTLVSSGSNFYVRFGTAPAVAQQVFVEYVLAQQGYIAAAQEKGVLATIMAQTVYTIVGTPISKSATRVFVDGLVRPSTDWTLTEGAQNYIAFLSNAPTTGQDVYVTYFEPVGTAGGSLTGLANEGTGVGVFDMIVGSNAVLRSIKAGTNVTVTDDMAGSIVIAASGGGSGQYTAHGSESSPITVTPSVGIVPTSDPLQTWYVKGVTSGGAQPVTANPRIAAHTVVGARLAIINCDASDYPTFDSGFGTFQNGIWPNSTIIQYAKIEYEWTGLRWSECYRLQ